MIVARQALDVHAVLQITDDRLGNMLDHLLGDLSAAPETAADSCISVSGDGPWSVRTPERVDLRLPYVEQALSRTLAAVNHAAVTRTPLLAFHAAVVTRRDRTLVVPARSGSGKSTLTACLLRQGWSYVSDEALALDWQTGRLSAYPRPMALSPWSCEAIGDVHEGLPAVGERVLRAGDLGAAVDTAPGPVTDVVLLERGADGEAPSLRSADRNEALTELLARGFTHHHDGGRALVLVADHVRRAEVVRLRLGDPRAAAALLTARADA